MAGTDIAIDLGSANFRLYVDGKGVVVDEPNVIAVDEDSNRVVAVGRRAYKMLGRTSNRVRVVKPVTGGVISDLTLMDATLQHYLKKVTNSRVFMPRAVVAVPSGITEVERRAVVDAVAANGIRKVCLIEAPVAAAIGAGIDITMPNGHMVVDIGGGTTDIAVISLSGVVVSESIKVAGDKFDEAIIRYVRKRHNVLIGERTAEAIKIKVGSAWERDEPCWVEVKGRCLVQGLPRLIRISSLEMPAALEEPITQIVEAVCSVIERTPPELIGDILHNGIVMTGGGSLLYGLDRLIANVTGVKTRVADKAVSCVAIGTGRSLEIMPNIPEGAINISRQRSQQKYY